LLIDKGYVEPEELLRVLQQNLASKLLDGFSWRQGSFRVLADLPEVASPLRTNVGQLIVLGVTRFATQDQVNGSIGPLIGRPLALHPAPLYRLEDIRMTPVQLAVVDGIKERHLRIDELAATSEIADEDLTRLLYALALIGVIVAADELPHIYEDLQLAHGREAEVRFEAMRPRVSGDSEELARLALRQRRKDPFDVLSIPLTATTADIQNSFVRFAQRCAPWLFAGEAAETARDVFLAGARAYGQLSDPEVRGEIVSRRLDEARTAAEPEQGSPRIRTTLLDADVHFRRGRAYMNSGEYEQAIMQLEYALDLGPQNAVCRAELAYCRFLAAPDSAGQTALDELRETLRMHPRCGHALYFSGEILRRVDRPRDAEDCLRRSIKLMGPDRRPIEALRALAAEGRIPKRRRRATLRRHA
jgi:tetratricopeptide (TPR) repeat protein